MGLRFDPSSTEETRSGLSNVTNMAMYQWQQEEKLRQEDEQGKRQLALLQKMGLIDGMPDATGAQPTAAPNLFPAQKAGVGGLVGPAMPPNAAMSMANGQVGDVSGKPVSMPSPADASVAAPAAPATFAPAVRKPKPLLVIPNGRGGYSTMKNPAYNGKQDSALAQLDLNTIPSPKSPEERRSIIDSLPPEIGENVKQVGTYAMDINKITSLRAGSSDRMKFDALVSKLYPDMVGESGFDSTEYTNRQNFRKSFFDPNRPTGIAINAIKQTTYHLGDLHDNVNALATTGSPLLNKPLRWWQQNAAGDPQISAVMTDLTAVGEEMTKAWAGNNNGEARVREWRKSMDTANSPEQWKAVMSTAANLLDGAVKARQSTFKATMKRDLDILDPDQKDILDNLKSKYNGKSSAKGVADQLSGKTSNGLSYTISKE